MSVRFYWSVLLLIQVVYPCFGDENKAKAMIPGVSPEVWMTHVKLQDLGRPDAQWDYVKQRLTGIELYINAIAFLCPAEDLHNLVEVIKKNKLKLMIECGYFDWANDTEDFTTPNPKGINDKVRMTFDRTVGEETARLEMRKLANLLNTGIVPDYLNLDGPIRRMLYPGEDVGKVHEGGFKSIEVCVEELLDYIRTWHEKYPTIRFFALTNFPNWGWKGGPAYWGDRQDGMHWGDYYEVAKCIIEHLKESGLPVCGFTVDNPYEYTIGTHPTSQLPDPKQINWLGRIRELENLVKSHNLEFNMIINSEGGGNATPEEFYKRTLDYLQIYQQAGGTPHRILIQTWYRWPEKIVPETELFTMTHLAKTVMEKLETRP